MPEKSIKGLLVGAGAIGTLAAGNVALEGRLAARARREVSKSQPKWAMASQSDRPIRQRAGVKEHPKKKWSEQVRSSNPKEFKRHVKTQRLARRAAKAGSRGMGALGLMVGAPAAISDARRIDKEGGRWADRFGKFVEKLTGMPPGSSGRGMTYSERRAARSI